MITEISIENFKCISSEQIKFAPLTILTGRNSSGKSTVLHAILLIARNCNNDNEKRMASLVSKFSDPEEVTNINSEEKHFSISMKFSDKSSALFDARPKIKKMVETGHLLNEHDLLYLSSNRSGPESITVFSHDYMIGDSGECVFSAYEQIFMNPIDVDFCKTKTEILEDIFCALNDVGADITAICKQGVKSGAAIDSMCEKLDSLKKNLESGDGPREVDPLPDIAEAKQFLKKMGTLRDILDLIKGNDEFKVNTMFFQVLYWLSYITETLTSLVTTRITTDQIKVHFLSNDMIEVNPLNLGTGMSYLAKVLIVSFMAKRGATVVIENPEIFLHPKAQARLGTFFSFMASKGIQFVIETHCEHLINNVRYNVFKGKIKSKDVIIHYKESAKKKFKHIEIGKNGHFQDEKKNAIEFPNSFFDATLDELMEM